MSLYVIFSIVDSIFFSMCYVHLKHARENVESRKK